MSRARQSADDPAQLRVQLARLKEQLAEEQLLRRQAEESVEVVAADRNRLQRARDELAAALLAAERRALEAEEEQAKSEAAAAALAQQLAEAQREAEAGAAREQGTAGSAAAPAGASGRVSSRHPEGSEAAALARDAEILLAELDRERQRSEELARTLDAAEREAVAATEKLFKAQQRIKQLEGKAKGKDAGSKDGKPDGLPRSASSSSLDSALAGGGGEAGSAAALHQRIAVLKASRDKLIGAFDAQAAEVERLSVDNAALAESLVQLRDVAAKWEAQAQQGLAQNERLKDLLEESATWGVPPTDAANPQAGAAAAGSSSRGAAPADGATSEQTGDGQVPSEAAAAAASGDSGALAALCQRFERELLLEKARSAHLDMQVRALCIELTRAAQSSSQMQASLAPLLGGVEARLVQVLGLRPRTGVLSSAA